MPFCKSSDASACVTRAVASLEISAVPSAVSHVGTASVPTYAGWQYNLTWTDPTIGASTYGGDSVVTYAGPAKRRLDLPFEGLSIADQQYLFDLVRVVGKTGELFLSAWPGNTANPGLERQCQMWCRIVETRGFTNPTLNRFGTGIVFEEL